MVIAINNKCRSGLYWINKIVIPIAFFVTGIVYVLLPSITLNSLMDGTQSGKTFTFLYLTVAAGALILLQAIFSKSKNLPPTLLDKLLLLRILFIIGNGYLHHLSPSLRLFELYGLVILYISLRQFSASSLIRLYFALITGGVIQAVYGNLQLWGYYPSHHNQFRVTGSFFNPGPYAGYLASVFTVALGFYLFKIRFPFVEKNSSAAARFIRKTLNILLPYLKSAGNTEKLLPRKHPDTGRTKKNRSREILMLISLIIIVPALFASQSRAAFIALSCSSAFLLFKRYQKKIIFFFSKLFSSGIKRAATIITTIILAGFISTGLYLLKRGSADGRMLIWNVSLHMIKDKPLLGNGFDRFKANYMNYQAAFFKQNPNTDAAMVAGDTNYAFNELLQQTVENGIVGLGFIVLIAIIIFTKQKEHHSPAGHPELNDLNPKNPADSTALCMIAKAGVITISIFSLFSYPAQILPIKTTLVLYLATVAGYSPRASFFRFNFSMPKAIHRTVSIYRLMLVFSVILLAYFVCLSLNNYINGYRYWKGAYHIYRLGAYEASLKDYEKAYPAGKTNGDFLTGYGKAASMAGRHEKAIEILKQAKKFYPNTVLCTAMGDSYKALGRYAEAEHAYFNAWYMAPSRFYPKYLLVRLYLESGRNKEALILANELLNKEIKVESEAIRKIKEEMSILVEKEKLPQDEKE